MKILVGVFNATLGREDISEPTAGSESLYQDNKLCHIKKSSC
jgi:hypothetical protein